MTTFWVGWAVALVLLFFLIWMTNAYFSISRRLARSEARVMDFADKYYEAKRQAGGWQERYESLEDEDALEKQDMDYVRDSLLRAADDDPMT